MVQDKNPLFFCQVSLKQSLDTVNKIDYVEQGLIAKYRQRWYKNMINIFGRKEFHIKQGEETLFQ